MVNTKTERTGSAHERNAGLCAPASPSRIWRDATGRLIDNKGNDMNKFTRSALYSAMAGAFILTTSTSIAATRLDLQSNEAAQTKPTLVAGKCNPCNPCSSKKWGKGYKSCNPCNPCAAKKACNPCAAKKMGFNPCNPCAAKKMGGNPCNPCNPCAAKKK